MKFDYRNTEDGQTENPVIPADTYEIEVIGCKEQHNQNSGNVQWIIKSKVISGNYINSKIDDFNVFSPSLDSANKAMLIAFGFPVDEHEMNIEPEELIGKKVLATIYIDTYNGKARNKVERFGGYRPVGFVVNSNSQSISSKNVTNENDDLPF